VEGGVVGWRHGSGSIAFGGCWSGGILLRMDTDARGWEGLR
jgi:hypothetical protein